MLKDYFFGVGLPFPKIIMDLSASFQEKGQAKDVLGILFVRESQSNLNLIQLATKNFCIKKHHLQPSPHG